MDRRTFVLSTGAALALPHPLLAATGQKYKPGLIAQALAEGRTVFADFYSKRCADCREQGKIIEALKASNPAYEAAMTFVAVDWRKHAKSEIAQALSVQQDATLLVVKMTADRSSFLAERLVAETSQEQIRALMDKGLRFAAA